MAAQKKPTNSRATNRTPAPSSGGSGRKAEVPSSFYRKRELGGLVCLLLALFAAIGYFTADGIFINFFRLFLSGCFGWGYWFAPPALLLGTYILIFHRMRPVKLRLICALLLPMFLGVFLHLCIVQADGGWSFSLLFPTLWKEGVSMKSGGVLSGSIAMLFRTVFGQAGSLILTMISLAAVIMGAFDRTIMDAVDYIQARREKRLEAEALAYQRDLEEDGFMPPPVNRRRQAADLPVDDSPAFPPKTPAPPISTVRRKKLFDSQGRVPAPGEMLSGERTVGQKPEYEDVPELSPVAEREQVAPPPPVSVPEEPDDTHDELKSVFKVHKGGAFGRKQSQEEVQPEPESEPQPESMPEIVRENAVRKASRAEETARATAQVTQEIENSMAQTVSAYRYPPLSLLQGGGAADLSGGRSELAANQARLDDALRSFGVEAHIVNFTRGPSVTRYELELEQGVKLNKITNLSDDIALALGAQAVRIAPIPEKISTVGIEVPNRQVAAVPIRDVIGSTSFTDSSSKVSFAVGKDIGGNPVVGNIARLPHMLIAGTTGSGKSVCTNSLIISLLYKATPEEVRLIMVDPKMVELGVYNGIPHLLIPVVTDPKKAAGALQWAVNEMMRRYRIFSEVGAKDLASYNNHARRRDDMETLPQVVVVIDELADLMLVAAKEVEESICRVAQMGRASGMHLVIATQRPSADVITGLMKANIPSRIAFAVASSLESRIILDQTGAEKLVGKGDMLYSPLGSGKPQRIQGCFISEEEVAEVVSFIKENGSARYDESVIHEIEQHAEEKGKGARGGDGAPAANGGDANDYDELLPAAIDVVLELGQASVSMLQRRLKLGYGRAARLVDQMEEKGIVGPFEGSKPRQLLITKDQWQEMQFKQNMAAGTAIPSDPVPEEFPFEGDAVAQPTDRPPF